ncbi:MAG: hypothetical protein NkDv07_0060 [Candidatus Improbicoccus devescovinae]|nr:MAG: hypothetical protein NkDv07_0060 [Candidatus Improbicoccus devescovinae]
MKGQNHNESSHGDSSAASLPENNTNPVDPEAMKPLVAPHAALPDVQAYDKLTEPNELRAPMNQEGARTPDSEKSTPLAQPLTGDQETNGPSSKQDKKRTTFHVFGSGATIVDLVKNFVEGTAAGIDELENRVDSEDMAIKLAATLCRIHKKNSRLSNGIYLARIQILFAWLSQQWTGTKKSKYWEDIASLNLPARLKDYEFPDIAGKELTLIDAFTELNKRERKLLDHKNKELKEMLSKLSSSNNDNSAATVDRIQELSDLAISILDREVPLGEAADEESAKLAAICAGFSLLTYAPGDTGQDVTDHYRRQVLPLFCSLVSRWSEVRLITEDRIRIFMKIPPTGTVEDSVTNNTDPETYLIKTNNMNDRLFLSTEQDHARESPQTNPYYNTQTPDIPTSVELRKYLANPLAALGAPVKHTSSVTEDFQRRGWVRSCWNLFRYLRGPSSQWTTTLSGFLSPPACLAILLFNNICYEVRECPNFIHVTRNSNRSLYTII